MPPRLAVFLCASLLLGGCATGARPLMPTPVLYLAPGGQPVFDPAQAVPTTPDVDLLFITDRAELDQHVAAKEALQAEVTQRLATAPSKEVLLYVHGFNESFATAAFTAAELCHFLGREQVCAFFSWPASTTGNFLISYTTTTESADFAVEHLKKTIRTLAGSPGV